MIRPSAIAAALLTALAVASCAGPDAPAPTLAAAGPGAASRGPGGRPSPAAVAACRQRADEIYLKQNRGLLSERDQRDTPYTSTGLPDNTARGLGEKFGRDQDFADCLRSFGPAAPTGAGPVIGTGLGVSPAMEPSGGGGPVTVGPPH